MGNQIGDRYADFPKTPEGKAARKAKAERIAIESADPDKGMRMRLNETMPTRKLSGFPKKPCQWGNE